MVKLNRTQNAIRNIISGSILKLFQIIMPFIVRTVFIYTLGMEYLGLNSLFTSILQVLNLSELGVGSAMVFSMYKPIADNDSNIICALMRLYRRYYRIIGFVVLLLGLAVLPFLRLLIRGDIPDDVNIYLLYLINLGATVISYWLFAYENALLTAHQRNDVSSFVFLAISIIQYGVQIVILYTLRNYYYYIVILPVAQILTNIITAMFAKRLFPQYHPSGNLDRNQIDSINSKIKDLFTSKLGSVVLNSVDSIVISAFLGLSMLAIYNNYYYILSSIIGFMTIILQSLTAGIGNSFVTETREKNYSDFCKISFSFILLITVCTCCFLNLFQPFMRMWVGQQNMLPLLAVVLLCLYFYVYEFNALLNTFKDAAGIWHEDRFRPLVVACLNLLLNIILVRFIGIFGIIISTIASISFVGLPWVTENLFRFVFTEFSSWSYLKTITKYSIAALGACFASFILTNYLPDGLAFFLARLVLSVTIPLILFSGIFKNSEGYLYFKSIIGKIIARQL